MGKGVHTVLEDGEVWSEFKSFVMRKHGKIHGVLGQELSKAMESYLSTYARKGGTHTHPAQRKKLDDLVATAKETWLRRSIPLDSSISSEVLKADLGRAYNVTDKRSINSRFKQLVMARVIDTRESDGFEACRFNVPTIPTPPPHMVEMACWYLIHDPSFPSTTIP